jgi:hypothetical protein
MEEVLSFFPITHIRKIPQVHFIENLTQNSFENAPQVHLTKKFTQYSFKITSHVPSVKISSQYSTRQCPLTPISHLERQALQQYKPQVLVQNIAEAHYPNPLFSVRLNQDKERRQKHEKIYVVCWRVNCPTCIVS